MTQDFPGFQRSRACSRCGRWSPQRGIRRQGNTLSAESRWVLKWGLISCSCSEIWVPKTIHISPKITTQLLKLTYHLFYWHLLDMLPNQWVLMRKTHYIRSWGHDVRCLCRRWANNRNKMFQNNWAVQSSALFTSAGVLPKTDSRLVSTRLWSNRLNMQIHRTACLVRASVSLCEIFLVIEWLWPNKCLQFKEIIRPDL